MTIQVQWGCMCMGLKDRIYITKQLDITINKQRLSLLLKHTFRLFVALVDESDCCCMVHSRDKDGCYSCGQLVECPDEIFQVVLSMQTW